MPYSFLINLETPVASGLYLEPYNNNDNFIYFNVKSEPPISLQPLDTLRVMVIPSGTLATGTVDALLRNQNFTGLPLSGIYVTGYKNDDRVGKTVSLPYIKIDRQWENTEFTVHWLKNDTTNLTYYYNPSGYYSGVRNLQINDITVSGQYSSSNSRMAYRFIFDEITASDDYTTRDPYLLNISYYRDVENTPLTGYFPSGTFVFPDSSTYLGFGSGVSLSGIYVELPYYDQRVSGIDVPAKYYVTLNTRCLKNTYADAMPIKLLVDHQEVKNNFIEDLNRAIKERADPTKLIEVEEIPIEQNILDRSRLSIGIKDISLNSITYTQNGTYISNIYDVNFPIYTLALEVDEFIQGLNSDQITEAVSYFIEINGSEWIRISPKHRKLERDIENKIIPKLIVFDISNSEEINEVMYKELTDIRSLRLKIVIDATNVPAQYTPPEIRNYSFVASSRTL